MPVDSPQIPPDLVELVIEELGDSSKDLSTCCLVCHEWLSLARNHITISPRDIPGFLDTLRSPTTTLFSTVRHLQIIVWTSEPERQTHLPLLQMLPQFTRLRSLLLWCSFPSGIPAIPWLTELDLSGAFGSYASFASFMSDLPALRSLVLDRVRWDDSPKIPLVFPSLELETLSLDFGKEPWIENITGL
ncbi:hypothetical protein MVEN_01576900 [Mycena venus]|uniref:F-box domain-containing protein n=1 Tax=Mycena venus TaxID=2733690 RepID=A0A8H7CRI2_9AGAR|nr:hypothetical protein MVEN_01576900 [Mycena venus]